MQHQQKMSLMLIQQLFRTEQCSHDVCPLHGRFDERPLELIGISGATNGSDLGASSLEDQHAHGSHSSAFTSREAAESKAEAVATHSRHVQCLESRNLYIIGLLGGQF